MYKLLVISIVILLTFSSCDYLDGIIHKRSNRIDFTSVDEYPFFPTCDSLATIEFKKKCFEDELVAYIKNDLEKQNFVSPKGSTTDAIIIHIEIDMNGRTILRDLETTSKIKEELPELEKSILESIASIPTMIPAKKRGHFVSSKYMIPLYIIE